MNTYMRNTQTSLINSSKVNTNNNNNNNNTCHNSNGTTPYQGRKRCFGEFKCQNCSKMWKSAKSRANEAQECSNCHALVFPQKQKSLESLYEELRKNKQEKLDELLRVENTNLNTI